MITRPTPAFRRRPIWYAASGRPAMGTSDFGRPPAASPSRSALPPARMIASMALRRRSADAVVAEAGGVHFLRIEQVAAVDEHGCVHGPREPRPVELAQLRPLGDDHGRIGSRYRLLDRLDLRDTVQVLRAGNRVP